MAENGAAGIGQGFHRMLQVKAAKTPSPVVPAVQRGPEAGLLLPDADGPPAGDSGVGKGPAGASVAPTEKASRMFHRWMPPVAPIRTHRSVFRSRARFALSRSFAR